MTLIKLTLDFDHSRYIPIISTFRKLRQEDYKLKTTWATWKSLRPNWTTKGVWTPRGLHSETLSQCLPLKPLARWLRNQSSWGWRNGSAAKKTCSCRVPQFGPHVPKLGSSQFGTAVPGNSYKLFWPPKTTTSTKNTLTFRHAHTPIMNINKNEQPCDSETCLA